MQSVILCGIGIVLGANCFFLSGQQTVSRTDDIAVEGRYRNEKYGYSIVVPAGLHAYRMKAPAPQHGIALDLKHGDVWVNAEYDATLARSVDVLGQTATDFWASSEQLRILKSSRTTLAGLPTRDVELDRDPYGSQINYIHFVLAYRSMPNSIGLVYTIGLKARFKDSGDAMVFWAIVRSFRLAAPK